MLAELYSHLKDEYPTHGLEIVFVSSDRDPGGFQQYFGCMPWMAVPFGGTIIPQIKQRYTSLLCVT
jgi:nucleoredoxin